MTQRTKPIKVPITGELPHDLWTPPHVMASKKQITAPQIVVTPNKSIWRNFSRNVADTGVADFGGRNAKIIAARATPPNGRLM